MGITLLSFLLLLLLLPFCPEVRERERERENMLRPPVVFPSHTPMPTRLVVPPLCGVRLDTDGEAESFGFEMGVQRRVVSGSCKINNSDRKGGQ